jgi:O-antigen/teichoic acid export membrane protein
MRKLFRVRFVRHVAMTSGAQASQAALAMVSGILVARLVGASARGTLAVLTATGGMAVLLASLGVHFSGVYFLGRFKSQRDAIVSNNLLAGVLGGLATGAVLAVVGVLFHRTLLHGIGLGFFVLYVCCVPFNYFNEFGRSLLLGIGRVGTYNIPDVFGGLALFTGTALAIVVFGRALLPLVALRVIVEVTTAVGVVAFILRAARLRFAPSRPLFQKQLKYGVRNYGSSLMWLFLLQSDVVLCNYFLGSHRTGVYSVAVSLGLPITMLAGVVGTLTFQRVASEERRERRIAQTNRAIRVLFPLILLTIAAMAIGARWLIPVIYGREFDPAVDALLLLLPGFLFYSLEIVMMNFLAGEGSPPIVIWGPLVGVVINVVANIFVIPRWGINGASVTSSVAYAVVFLLVLAYYKRSTRSSILDVLGTRLGDIHAFTARHTPRETGPRAEAATL